MALPDGPAAPTAWQTAAWIARPGPFMERCRRRYGDLFTIKLPASGTIVLVADPDAVKQVFTTSPDILRAGEGNRPLEPVLGSRSLLLLDGRDHLRHRRLMLPSFHGDRLAGYADLMRQIAVAELESWPRDRPIRMQPRMQAITLEIILRVVFGIDERRRLDRMRAAIVRLLDIATSPAALVPQLRRDLGRYSIGRRLFDALAAVDSALFDEIAARRHVDDLEEREDILSLLVQARDDEGRPMTDRELRDELITLLVAGHETTATALAWACERIVRTPGTLDRLLDEARAGETAYADAVVAETLRLRQPIPVVARKTTQAYELMGYDIPPGTVIAPCVYLIHRRADIYPDPYAFRPERFLERPPETYTWLPFGGGIRRCIGARFATFEMRVVLQAIVERLRLEAHDPQPEPVGRRAIVLAPARGGRVVTTARASDPSSRPVSDRAPLSA
jgi:cytochrome P450 family 135